MSSNDDEGSGGDSGPGRREVAHRLFACEFDAATLEYADSDEERAPKYVITPTGARVNRLFVVGVLTEVQRVNEDVVRARVVDPTGAFVVYAGQYQPDALAFLERADPPMFVAVTGKANTFQPEDTERVYTSVRPESVAEVDAETRDRWTVQAAEHTLRRIGEFAAALERGEVGNDPAGGIALAHGEYGTTPAYLAALRETVLDAARLVSSEVDEVAAPSIAPGQDDGRTVDLESLHVHDAGASEPDTGVAGADDTLDTSEPSAPSEPNATGPGTEATAEPEPDAGGPERTESNVDEEPTETETPAESNGSATGAADDGGVSDGTEATPVEPEPEAESGSEDLGDFDVGETDLSESEPNDEVGMNADPDGEGDLYEFDEEERAEIEAEFDMEFSSGSEVEDPGKAGIDVPDAEELDGPEGTAGAGEPEADPEEGTEPDVDADDDSEGSVNVEDRAMDAMRDLAGGDGADREAVIERVATEHGVESAAVDDAIESALLSGRCYEPQDGVLKPI